MGLCSKVSEHRLNPSHRPSGLRTPGRASLYQVGPGAGLGDPWSRESVEWAVGAEAGSQANLRGTRCDLVLGSVPEGRLTLGLLRCLSCLSLHARAQTEVASGSRDCLLISRFHPLVFNPNRAVTAGILLQGELFFKPVY